MDPITPGIISNLITQVIAALGQRYFGGQIKITSPRPHEVMSDPKALGPGFSYVVRGTLSRLPKGHKVWVLTQDESTGGVWPQSFEDARYFPDTKTWEGRISGSGERVTILAVVAPPTTQDYFRYFQKLGVMRKYNFEPLSRVPPECVNSYSVQAEIPSG